MADIRPATTPGWSSARSPGSAISAGWRVRALRPHCHDPPHAAPANRLSLGPNFPERLLRFHVADSGCKSGIEIEERLKR